MSGNTFSKALTLLLIILCFQSLGARETLPRVVVSGFCKIKDDNVSDFGLDFALEPLTKTQQVFSAIGVLKESDYRNNRFMVWAKRPFEHRVGNEDVIRVRFLEMFYLKSAGANHITIQRRSDFKELKFSSAQFTDNFFWYDQLIDLTRHGLPVYGFISLPEDETELIDFYNTYEPKGEENVFARYRDGWADLDFYKVLDYRKGHYLLARDGEISLAINERTGEHEIQLLPASREFGVLGWVKEKYVLLWRSREYYHPLDATDPKYYKSNSSSDDTVIQSKIKSYYVDTEYREKPYFTTFHLDERIYYDKYYRNFGFPTLHPLSRPGDPKRRVAIIGTYTSAILRTVLKNTHQTESVQSILYDPSRSMISLRPFVNIFLKQLGKQSHSQQSKDYQYVYYDYHKPEENKDYKFTNISNIMKGEMGREIEDDSKSLNYRYLEPLCRGLKEMTQIKGIKSGVTNSIIIITDAGPNDLTFYNSQLKDDLRRTRLIFVIPDRPPVNPALNEAHNDAIRYAYASLLNFVRILESDLNEPEMPIVHTFKFSNDAGQVDFGQRSNDIIGTINDMTDKVATIDKDALLRFIPIETAELIKEIVSQDKNNDIVQAYNHSIRYIDVNEEKGRRWGRRVAIPYSLVELYHDALGNPELNITADDFKKALFVNNFTNIAGCFIENIDIYNNLVSILQVMYPNHNWNEVNRVLFSSYLEQGDADKAHFETLDELLADKGKMLQALRERDYFLNLVQALSESHKSHSRYVYFLLDEITGRR